MKCYECGHKMSEKKINYRYIESGLDNVYLMDISEFTCPKCKESFVDIPNPIDLHITLAISISNKPAPLTGPEIRFMRNEIGMSSKGFAEKVGVSPVTLSRWENDKSDANKSKSHDKLIRFAFKEMMTEKLKVLISYIEDQIRRNTPVHMTARRINVDTEAIKRISLGQQSSCEVCA